MAHFAKINLNTHIVLEVHVVNNSDIQDLPFPQSEPVGIEYLIPWNTVDTYWKQTSYNRNFRKNYACIGGTYDQGRDAFIPHKIHSSWILDEVSCDWIAPVDCPTDGKNYDWDEATTSWVETPIGE
jgi:hypothetical protein